MPPKSFNKPFEFSLSYKTNRLHFSVCLYCKVSFPCSHRENWFAARCECFHLIKQNSQCLFASCEFFLTRYKYSQRAANRFLRWLEQRLNKSQKTQPACKNSLHEKLFDTRLFEKDSLTGDEVEWRAVLWQHCTQLDFVLCPTFLFSLHAVTLSMIYYSTHGLKNVIYSLNTTTQLRNYQYIKDKIGHLHSLSTDEILWSKVNSSVEMYIFLTLENYLTLKNFICWEITGLVVSHDTQFINYQYSWEILVWD